MPKILFDTLDAIPEALRGGAKQEDGKIAIDVVESTKLNEFRDNNIKLSSERDQLTARIAQLAALTGDDAEAFAAELEVLRQTKQQVDDGKLKGSDTIAKEVETRIGNLKGEHAKEIAKLSQDNKAWQEKANTLDTRLKRTFIDREITAAVLNEESGADPRALGDILTRAYDTYSVEEDGKLVAKAGEAIIYGGDGVTPLPPAEWLGKLKETAPYFFKASAGGGAGGSDQKIPGNYTAESFGKLSGAEQLRIARAKK